MDNKKLQEMNATSSLIKNSPELLTGTEGVNELVMSDSLNMVDGTELASGYDQATEAAPVTFKPSGIANPNKEDTVLLNTVLSLLNPEEAAQFKAAASEVNKVVSAAYKKYRGAMEKGVSNIIKIENKDVNAANNLQKKIKEETDLVALKLLY